MELRVFEIERFAVHDGPGIRTVVFLKGCGLHCPWCSNPESQSAARQLLRDEKKCAACGACARACPNGAVSWTPGEMPRVDRARCRACGACAAICPAGALSLCGELMTAEEIERVVLRDRDYYEDSGGGVTFSGGEAVLQAPARAPGPAKRPRAAARLSCGAGRTYSYRDLRRGAGGGFRTRGSAYAAFPLRREARGGGKAPRRHGR